MSINRGLITLSKAHDAELERTDVAIVGMVEPFTVLDLYPSMDVEEDGRYITKKRILPHQQRLHDHKTRSGEEWKYALINGGYGCLGGETILAGRPICDWVADQKAPLYLRTLFGVAVPEVPYLKGQADLYRVRTVSGREVVVTAQHRFLSTGGWVPLSDLRAGDVIAADGNWRDPSEKQTARGYPGDCFRGSRQDGELLPPAVVAALDRWQQLHRTGGDNSAWQAYTLLSTGGCKDRIGDSRVVASLLSYALAFSEQPLDRRHTAGQYQMLIDLARIAKSILSLVEVYGCPDRPQCCICGAGCGIPERPLWRGLLQPCACSESRSIGEEPRQVRLSADGCLCQCESRFHAGLWTRLTAILQARERQLSEYRAGDTPLWSVQEWGSCLDYTSFWEEIASIEWVRYDDFYDIGVPGDEHYGAQGLLHHNSGKSLSMHAEFVYLARRYPGIQLITVAGYDWMFDEFIWITLRKIIGDFDEYPYIEKFLVKERRLIFTNGSEWHFKAFDEAEKVKGFEVHCIWVEEGDTLGDGDNYKATAIFNALQGRHRAPGNYPRKFYVSQNPRGHNWSWKLFVKDSPNRNNPFIEWIVPPMTDPTNPEGVWYEEYELQKPGGDVWWTVSSQTYGNTINPPDYLSSMVAGYSDALARRRIRGSFDPIGELVYDRPNYAPESHVVPLQNFLAYWKEDLDGSIEDGIDAIPRNWPLIVGIDCGGRQSPWAILFAVETPAQEWVIIHEIYRRGCTWGEIADAILTFTEGPLLYPEDGVTGMRDREMAWHTVHYYADPISSVQRQGPDQKTIRDVFNSYGINITEQHASSVNAGTLVVRDNLKPDKTNSHPYIDDEYNEDRKEWEIGWPRILFLKDDTYITYKEMGKPTSVDNPEGHISFFTQLEFTVYRHDTKRMREPKESEEGLSPPPQEKILDRDNHCCDAIRFLCMGHKIQPRYNPNKRKGIADKEADVYGLRRHRRGAHARYGGER